MPSAAESDTTERVFFALRPDAELRARIAALQMLDGWSGRPVPPGNLHLTLVFIGEVDGRRLETLKDLAADRALPPCGLSLDRLGWFPRPGVGWLGCSGGAPDMFAGFQRRLASSVSAAGFDVDMRRWTPHVTLYRHLRKAPPTMRSEPLEWRVEAFELMASRPREDGAGGVEYHTLGRWLSAR
ncbi:MAG: RNA 2',3'-cyclic phosphodiesterase [Xanthomonadales bacterium]|nr:RNA 2',3'-cyclic phosphodiesterase [Xanthomonadales bacterium]